MLKRYRTPLEKLPVAKSWTSLSNKVLYHNVKNISIKKKKSVPRDLCCYTLQSAPVLWSHCTQVERKLEPLGFSDFQKAMGLQIEMFNGPFLVYTGGPKVK